jgi:hypothetical protein
MPSAKRASRDVLDPSIHRKDSSDFENFEGSWVDNSKDLRCHASNVLSCNPSVSPKGFVAIANVNRSCSINKGGYEFVTLDWEAAQGLVVSTRLSHCHLARRAQLMRLISRTPKPPSSVGRQTLLQDRAQLPPPSSLPLA